MSWEEMSSRRETSKFLGVAVLVTDTHGRDEEESEKDKAGNEITLTLNKIRYYCTTALLWEKIKFYY